jgi:hypothetical protein
MLNGAPDTSNARGDDFSQFSFVGLHAECGAHLLRQ